MRVSIAMDQKLDDYAWRCTCSDAFGAHQRFWVQTQAVTTRAAPTAQGAGEDIDSLADRVSWRCACHGGMWKRGLDGCRFLSTTYCIYLFLPQSRSMKVTMV